MNSAKTPDEQWALQKARIKLMFSHLHEEDFNYDYGKKDVMMTNLQSKLGKSREELNELLNNLKA